MWLPVGVPHGSQSAVKDLAGVGLWHGKDPQVLVERTTHQMHLTLQRLLQRAQVVPSTCCLMSVRRAEPESISTEAGSADEAGSL